MIALSPVVLVDGIEIENALGGGLMAVRETHISRVLIGAERVLKLKKPVDFGFLDYTTLEKRRACCQAEVALNSRMCPSLYLGVVEIQAAPGEPVTDYGVLMKRLPAERMLDALVRQGEATEAMIERAVRRLADFHRTTRRGPDVDAFGQLEVIAGNWEENFRQTQPYVGRTIGGGEFDQIRQWVRATLETRRPQLASRVRAGRIVDGHGDVRCESICVVNGICFFDCIEFNDRFRCGDAASEIAFLGMDLHSLGRPDLAFFATERYAEFAGDAALYGVLPLYLCYRAFVRGKVLSFRLDQTGLSETERNEAHRRAAAFFELASRYARPLPRPALIMVCGRSGTGKTSVARGIGHELGLPVLSTDAIRLELLGSAKRPAAFEKGAYAPETTQRVYEEMAARARIILAAGGGVILDGTFLRESQRRVVRETTHTCGCPGVQIECQLEPAEVRRRLERRAARQESDSDANWDIYLRQAMEPPAPAETGWHLLNTERPVGECAAAAADWLRSACVHGNLSA